jgi:hypothetical protein
VKVEHALKDVREEFSRDRHAALAGLRHRVIAVFRRIFSRLGTRNFRFRRKHKNHVPLVEDYNRDLRDISMDLTALYEETKSLRGLQQEVFNYNQVLTEDLVNRAAKGASQVIDLRLLAGQLQEDLRQPRGGGRHLAGHRHAAAHRDRADPRRGHRCHRAATEPGCHA